MTTSVSPKPPMLASSLPERLNDTIHTLHREYTADTDAPWVVAYSGGKDSTLLFQLTWEVVASLPPSQRQRKIYIIGNDTLVESPLVVQHLRSSMKRIQLAAQEAQLPIETRLTKPNIDQTFWVNVIGRGYIPPTRNFRWCTDRMKIIPTNALLAQLVQRHQRAVLLVGTRKSESLSRRRSIEKHHRNGASSLMNPHSTIPNCEMFAPLAELEDNDVWLVLLQRDPPWGGTHEQLITLYRNAGGGECPLILSKDDAPSCGTTSPRFGCWTCTVVNKDRSLRGLIDSGHGDSETFEKLFDFREWLISLRENDEYRLRVRRNGLTKTKEDGTRVLGPFTLQVRQRILDQLKVLQESIGEQLISASEIQVIEDIWRRDQLQENCREALRNTYS